MRGSTKHEKKQPPARVRKVRHRQEVCRPPHEGKEEGSKMRGFQPRVVDLALAQRAVSEPSSGPVSYHSISGKLVRKGMCRSHPLFMLRFMPWVLPLPRKSTNPWGKKAVL